ncbi:hypothetical protein Ocin01_06519 [Orchesella cincta]|uniref:Uncharacterized protein n=1 Tax=Orchesella cincta TaxID=48709 RepID=A0A1D2N4J8_ORCCI|nr:hypothetical protein Ocin01_06519 [Orchesella cincta]
MMFNALIIIFGFLVTIMSLTDSQAQTNEAPTTRLSKFILTLGFSIWFFSVVLSLAEEIELEDEESMEAHRVRSCTYVAKSGHEIIGEKSPPYYDC